MRSKFDFQSFAEDFTRSFARGVTSRHPRESTPPQARWMECDAIYASESLAFNPDKPGRKVLFGALGDKLIGLDDNRHILTVAGSRAGKSVGIVNNALFYAGSMIVIDPKGELANKTARRRAEFGQRVAILDPAGIVHERLAHFRCSYNPMSVLQVGAPDIVESADGIVDALIVVAEKDPHWDESSRNFISGVILHVASHPRYEGQRNLVTARDLINRALVEGSLPEGAGDNEAAPFVIEEEMLENAWRLKQSRGTFDLGAAIEGAARDFYDKSDRERDSVLSSARRHTKFLDYAGIRSVSQGHDFDLADLKREKLTLYLCVPASLMGIYQRWLRLFVQQFLAAMEQEKTTPDVPVLACLDEFAVLGYVRALEDAIGQIASFHVRLWVICQDLGQIKALYKERWESIPANAGVIQCFGNTDLTTTEWISRKLGRTSMPVTRPGEATPEQRAAGVTGRSTSFETHDLLAPEEVALHFSRDSKHKKQLLMLAGHDPIAIQRVEYFDERGPFHHVFKGKYD